MSNLKLRRVSPLQAPLKREAVPQSSEVIILECQDVAVCSIIARAGRKTELLSKVEEQFSLALPQTSGYRSLGSIEVVCIGPDQWIAKREKENGKEFEAELSALLGNTGSVFDLSDGRVVFKISGSRARDTLTKGLLIDLHPTIFKPGSAAVTSISYIGVQLWQVNDLPTYEISVFRSFAVSFLEWLLDAGAEYGVAWKR